MVRLCDFYVGRVEDGILRSFQQHSVSSDHFIPFSDFVVLDVVFRPSDLPALDIFNSPPKSHLVATAAAPVGRTA